MLYITQRHGQSAFKEQPVGVEEEDAGVVSGDPISAEWFDTFGDFIDLLPPSASVTETFKQDLRERLDDLDVETAGFPESLPCAAGAQAAISRLLPVSWRAALAARKSSLRCLSLQWSMARTTVHP